MKVKIDPDVCIGCGLCAASCPDVFRMQDDKAVVYLAAVPDNLKDALLQSESDCPVAAITVCEC